MATAPFFFGTPKRSSAMIVNADASALKTVVTGAGAGTKLVALIASTDDSTARDIEIGITVGTSFFALGTKNVPITAGTVNSVPAVNLLDPNYVVGLPVDNDGQPYLFLNSGDTLQAKSLTTVTAAKVVSIVAVHGDG